MHGTMELSNRYDLNKCNHHSNMAVCSVLQAGAEAASGSSQFAAVAGHQVGVSARPTLRHVSAVHDTGVGSTLVDVEGVLLCSSCLRGGIVCPGGGITPAQEEKVSVTVTRSRPRGSEEWLGSDDGPMLKGVNQGLNDAAQKAAGCFWLAAECNNRPAGRHQREHLI